MTGPMGAAVTMLGGVGIFLTLWLVSGWLVWLVNRVDDWANGYLPEELNKRRHFYDD
jgi:hypothetical protein